MSNENNRHFGMDWLRIGAFQLLILYHVGMAFVPWDYQVKVVNPPLDWVQAPMLLTNPWRLSLLFAISGYASAALFARAGRTRAFLSSRLKRLGLPLLFGITVIVTPQPWVWVITHEGYNAGFLHFLAHDYFGFKFIGSVAMPTWMHLWFVVYLLVYTFLAAVAALLPAHWRSTCARFFEKLLASPALLPLGIAWIYLVRTSLSPGWEDNHALAGDWSAHATYLPMFLFGWLLRHSERLRGTIVRQWRPAAVLALAGWAVLATFVLTEPVFASPAILRVIHGSARATAGWAAIVALFGSADRYWNIDTRWRAMLAEAVFPFYLAHQTIIIVVGYWLLASPVGALGKFLILVAATAGGCWSFYLVGREVTWLRPLIGLGHETVKGRSRRREISAAVQTEPGHG